MHSLLVFFFNETIIHRVFSSVSYLYNVFNVLLDTYKFLFSKALLCLCTHTNNFRLPTLLLIQEKNSPCGFGSDTPCFGEKQNKNAVKKIN